MRRSDHLARPWVHDRLVAERPVRVAEQRVDVASEKGLVPASQRRPDLRHELVLQRTVRLRQLGVHLDPVNVLRDRRQIGRHVVQPDEDRAPQQVLREHRRRHAGLALDPRAAFPALRVDVVLAGVVLRDPLEHAIPCVNRGQKVMRVTGEK